MKKRKYGIDLIKVIAAILVIAVHHFSTIGYYETKFGSNTMLLATALYVICLSCVPLFLVSTGYLLANREINYTHYKKILYFLIEVFLIYTFGILIVISLRGDFNVIFWIKQSIRMFLSPSYYIGLYFSLYLIAPFINKLFYTLTIKEKRLFVIVVFFVISLPNFLNFIFNITFFDTRPTGIWAILYYIIGLYIKDFQPKIKTTFCLLFIILLAISYSLFYSHSLNGETFKHILGYYDNIFTVGITMLLFISMYNINIENNFFRIAISFLSSSTLTLYLFSGMYSDTKAMEYISLTKTLLFNLPSLVPKVILSILFSLPLAILVYYSMRYVTLKIDKITGKVQHILKYKNT